MTKLFRLYISHNDITDRGAADIFMALNVWEIDLTYDHITDAGASQIAQIVAAHRVLPIDLKIKEGNHDLTQAGLDALLATKLISIQG